MPQIQFKGKTFVQNHHLAVPYHELIPRPDKSLTAKVSLNDNLIIHGDNLKALKALLPLYAGKVKCIYIDPPYNTGNEGWKYNDSVNSPMMQDWLGKVVDREDLTRHDKWLCMMMPRLRLLRDLLHEEGVILVSIDDNEVHNLRSVMEDIFGEDNFVAQLVWEKGRKNDARLFSVGHEYITVFTRSLVRLHELRTIWRESKPGAKDVWAKYTQLRGKHGDDLNAFESELQGWYESLPKRHAAKALSRYKHVDNYGPWRDRDISWPGGGGPRYDVIHPVTKKPCKVPERGWGFATPEAMQEQIDLELVVFRHDHTEPPIRKAHLRPVPDELGDEDTWADEGDEGAEGTADVGMQVMPSVLYKQTQVTTKYFRQLGLEFPNPKDHEVLARVIRYVTSGDPTAIVLDSFAGSSTTAHAVLALNKEDGGNRRFILVEREDYADAITAERVRRVIRGVPTAKDEALRNGLGGTFSFFELGKPIDVDSMLSGEHLPSYRELARYVFYTATGEEFDESKVDEARGFIGESRERRVYLLYKPDVEELKKIALTLDRARSLGPIEGKRRLVFAPTKYLDQEYLDDLRIDFAQLPFEIYRAVH